jgi:hypothetical protein
MKTIALILACFLVCQSGFSQNSELWIKGKNWRLYDVGNREIGDLRSDTLDRLPSAALSDDTLLSYLKDASMIPREKSAGAVWMGSYWVSYLNGSHPHLLKVSSYGGFFVDWNTGDYYELPIWERQSWLTYLSSAAVELQLKRK